MGFLHFAACLGWRLGGRIPVYIALDGIFGQAHLIAVAFAYVLYVQHRKRE